VATSEPKVREFRRPHSGLSPWFLYFVVAWLGLGGVANLLERRWLWSTGNFLGAFLILASDRWAKRTPIVRVTGEEVIVYRAFLLPTRRIRIASVASVDQPRPTVLRFMLLAGDSYVIPLHWLAWGDRPTFIETIRSALRGTGT
jgi:hypothetical protein